MNHLKLRQVIDDNATEYGWNGQTADATILSDGNAETVANPNAPSPRRYDIEKAIRGQGGAASARVDAFGLLGTNALARVQGAADSAAVLALDAATQGLAAAWMEWNKYGALDAVSVTTAAFGAFFDAMIAAGLFTAEDKAAAVAALPPGGQAQVSLWAANGLHGVREGDIAQARAL